MARSERNPLWVYAICCGAIMLVSPIVVWALWTALHAFPGELSVNGRALPTYLVYFIPGGIWFALFAVLGGITLIFTRRRSCKLRIRLIFASLGGTLLLICYMVYRGL